jgi:hypothetical protein
VLRAFATSVSTCSRIDRAVQRKSRPPPLDRLNTSMPILQADEYSG